MANDGKRLHGFTVVIIKQAILPYHVLNKMNEYSIEGLNLFAIGPRPRCLSMLLSANVSIWQADKQS